MTVPDKQRLRPRTFLSSWLATRRRVWRLWQARSAVTDAKRVLEAFPWRDYEIDVPDKVYYSAHRAYDDAQDRLRELERRP